jgi:hypothetical protein
MTRVEKVAALQLKADALIQWFEGRQLPGCPFKLKPWMTVLDCEKYLHTTLNTMAAHRNDPFNRQFVLGFYRLTDLKQYIENANKSTDSNTTPVPKIN